MRGEWDVSIRRACGVFEMDTSTYHYKSRRPGQAHLEQRIREICQTRVRYGYRRIHVLLRREGCRHGQNKTRRIYRELGLQLRNKTPKRRVKAKLRDDRRPATRSNETWAMDFVHDQLATGRKLRVLTIVDTFLEEAPGILAELRTALAAADVDGYRRAAHSLKSNGNTFGALAFASMARDAELGGFTGDAATDGAVLDALEAAFTAAAAELKKLLNG